MYSTTIDSIDCRLKVFKASLTIFRKMKTTKRKLLIKSYRHIGLIKMNWQDYLNVHYHEVNRFFSLASNSLHIILSRDLTIHRHH